MNLKMIRTPLSECLRCNRHWKANLAQLADHPRLSKAYCGRCHSLNVSRFWRSRPRPSRRMMTTALPSQKTLTLTKKTWTSIRTVWCQCVLWTWTFSTSFRP